MAYKKLNFSRTALVDLPSPEQGKRLYYTDTKEPGLVLSATSSGTKSFQVYLKVAGRPVRVTLGRFSPSLAESVDLPRDCSHNEFWANNPELNVRMARSLAALVKIDLKSGLKPNDLKRARRDETTLGELAEEYVTRHMLPHGLKSVDQFREDFERYLGKLPDTPRKKHGKQRVKPKGSVDWSNRPISSITRGEIQKVHAELGRERGRRTGNRVLTMLKPMYNRAIDWGLFNKANPAKGIKLFRLESRERFLQADELPRFFAAVALEENEDVRDYILLSLMTGARKSNVLSMRWADINLDRETWRVPKTKNGESQTIPLMPEAVEILANRKPEGPAEHVFPGSGKSGHMEDPKKGWERVMDRDEIIQLQQRIEAAGGYFEWPLVREKAPGHRGRTYESLTMALKRARKVAEEMAIDTAGARLDDLHIHDLRRTLGSWQAATGASLVVIGKSLGHKNLASTQIYSRLNLDPVRDSMQTATRAMMAAAKQIPVAEVVPIKKKAV